MRTAVDTPLGYKVLEVGRCLAPMPILAARGGTLAALCPPIERRPAAVGQGV